MRLLLMFIFLFWSILTNAQTKGSAATKLFFEAGFANTKVFVLGERDTLLIKPLTTNYKLGYAQILTVKKQYETIVVKTGKMTQKIQVRPNMFYRINIRDNELFIDEVSEEPIYI